MSKLNYDSEQIQRYLLKEMSERETKEFESQMAKDPNLKAEVSQAFVLHQMVIEKRLFEVNDLLKDISSPKPRKGKGPIIGSVLIVVAVLGGLGYFLVNSQKDSLAKEGFAESIEIVDGDKSDNDSVKAKIRIGTREFVAVENKEIPANVTKHAPQQNHNIRLKPVLEEMVTEPKNIEESIIKNVKDETVDRKVPQSKVEIIQKLVDPCLKKSWSFNIETTTTCMGINTGEIRIESALNKVNYAIGDDELGTIHEWEELAAGSYSVHVVDDGGCDTNLTVFIKAAICRLTGPDYEFYLQSDIELGFRDLDQREGEVQIIDQSGRTVKALVFEEGDLVTWDGKTESGESMNVGFLSYIIKFNDGDIMKGGITVLP